MLRISSSVFVLLVLVTAIRMSGSDHSKKLLLTVYYESKCPDSRTFIVDQLVPAMDLLEDYVDLDLIPFGKARSINSSRIRFECQHGQKECTGNMVQSCTIDLMLGRTSDLRIAKYAACEMTTEAGTRRDLECVRQARVNTNMVDHCMSSGHGVALQLRHEKETNVIRPRFIPTVTINNKFSQKNQDMAIEDLALTLCKFLRHETPCTRRFNNIEMDDEQK